MNRYYLELTTTGATIFVIKHDDRHKLWVSNPTAKEISKKQYDNILEAIKPNNNG